MNCFAVHLQIMVTPVEKTNFGSNLHASFTLLDHSSSNDNLSMHVILSNRCVAWGLILVYFLPWYQLTRSAVINVVV